MKNNGIAIKLVKFLNYLQKILVNLQLKMILDNLCQWH
jgi:hypothetical protein